jgi:hypothetical protein
MRRSAGFDADEARRQPLKEWQNVPALERTANDYITCRVNSVDLKNRLGDIETDCRDRLHVWLPGARATLAAAGLFGGLHVHIFLRHREAVGGGVTSCQRNFTKRADRRQS